MYTYSWNWLLRIEYRIGSFKKILIKQADGFAYEILVSGTDSLEIRNPETQEYIFESKIEFILYKRITDLITV